MDPHWRQRAIDAREPLAAGELRGAALHELLASVPFVERDAFVDELLGLAAPPADVDLPRGSVPYLPCSADAIVTMVREVPLRADDDLVDLGAGLGRAIVLAHLLSGTRARGIEIQPQLVEQARALATRLGLERVSFDHGDIADAVPDARVYFLYAPCNGAMLATVLDRMAAIARRRRFVVCAVGMSLGEAPFLVERVATSSEVTIFDSR